MCDIYKITKRKSIIVYKLVDKINDDYVAIFSGMIVKPGIVKDLPFYYDMYNCSKNDFMYGQCSGFKYLNHAKHANTRLYGNIRPSTGHTILQVEMTGIIKQGTSSNIGDIPENYPVFSGSVIESIKEIKQ